MSYPCFMAERTNRYQRALRRYVASQQEMCTGRRGYHDAVRRFDVIEAPPEDTEIEGNSTVEFCGKDDPRWPVACECGHVFRADDMWQWDQHRLYRNPATGDEFTLFDAPVGAMWTADWMGWKGTDGHCLVVQTPGGEWMIDGPSSDGERSRGPCWTRTGTPPLVTARPSILMRCYHGFLTDGMLSESL